MGETSQIATFAYQLYADFFKAFGWKTTGHPDTNYSCTHQELHDRKQHSTDVVLSHPDTHNSEVNISYLTDLKSYSTSTLKNSRQITEVLVSLAKSVYCANFSEEWKKNYEILSNSCKIYGLLFVFNHDGEYDKNFLQWLKNTRLASKFLPEDAGLFIFEPACIAHLNTVVNDIAVEVSKASFGDSTAYDFHIEPLRTEPRTSLSFSFAPIQQLLSPILIVRFKKEKNFYRLYYRNDASRPEEFEYLIAYLFHTQLIYTAEKIEISPTNPHEDASTNLTRGKELYVKSFKQFTEAKKLLNKISYKSITQVTRKFNYQKIGLESTYE